VYQHRTYRCCRVELFVDHSLSGGLVAALVDAGQDLVLRCRMTYVAQLTASRSTAKV